MEENGYDPLNYYYRSRKISARQVFNRRVRLCEACRFGPPPRSGKTQLRLFLQGLVSKLLGALINGVPVSLNIDLTPCQQPANLPAVKHQTPKGHALMKATWVKTKN